MGDWTGSGTKKMGIYKDGFWMLDLNGNGQWDGTAVDAFYAMGGNTGEIPVVGDWTGNGKDKIGIYYQGFWELDLNGNGQWDGTPTDAFFGYGGNSNEYPVVGDWSGSGTTKIGVMYSGVWDLDYDGDGTWSYPVDKYYTSYPFQTGDLPVVGDWTGSQTTKIGLYRQGFWILDTNGTGTWDYPSDDRFAAFGGAGAQPIVGDWSGTGSAKIGVFYPTTVSSAQAGTWQLDYNGNFQFESSADLLFQYGSAGDQPVFGYLGSTPSATPGTGITVTTTVPGQNAQITFSGTAGQQVSLTLTNSTYTGPGCYSLNISIIKPDGTTLGSTYLCGEASGFLDTQILPSTGVYTILIDPPGSRTGSVSVLLNTFTTVTGAVSPGSAVSITTTKAGQDARYTFSGTAGQLVSVKLTNSTYPGPGCYSLHLSILKPDGTTLVF